ncbi:MAG: response regulator [Burkholderiaceae bacterium]|nr:response regulator [Burkholderiaceae bacterium]
METPLCVAVVEDESPVRTALCRLLRLADYTALGFASGEEFLASLDARRPDCVLLDIHMPGLSGVQVRQRLRESGSALPVVFITANDSAELARQGLDPAGSRVLHKPFSADEMLDAITSAIGVQGVR